MNSSLSTTDLASARKTLDRIQRQAYQDLGIPIPDADTTFDAEDDKRYFATNPDITPSRLTETLAEFDQQEILQPNVVDLSSSPSRSVLNQRVRELQSVARSFDKEQRLARTCFGTIPGGGLDASSFKLEDTNTYAIVIPDGFFHLSNLLTKLVILLQPFTPTAQGPVFMPSASFQQIGLTGHPYIKFRHQDLLQAFFLSGDPTASLPYHQAIPFQDRFAYLLLGTELFVLAHELAHVLLGHLDGPLDEGGAAQRELDADEMALRIVTQFFRAEANYPVARASLCGTLFLSMVRMWETGLEHILGDPRIAASHTHPTSTARFQRFADALANEPHEETPGWYLFTHNAIRFATQPMSRDVLEGIAAKARSGDGVSARVLPRAHQHLGHFNGPSEERWWLQIADLLTSTNPPDQRLGLWFLVDNLPQSAIGIYRGLLSEEETIKEKFERALIAVEPLYSSYIPRLRERYRETAQNDEFEAYLVHLAIYLGGASRAKLRKSAADSGPMSPDFFIVKSRRTTGLKPISSILRAIRLWRGE